MYIYRANSKFPSILYSAVQVEHTVLCNKALQLKLFPWAEHTRMSSSTFHELKCLFQKELIILYHGSVLYLFLSTVKCNFRTHTVTTFMSTDLLSEELICEFQCISFPKGRGKNLIGDVP
jgi:hypothetical protein